MVCVACLTGCGEQEESVEAGLAEMGYVATIEDFHRAAEIGDVGAMGRLLDQGVALDGVTGDGDTALHAAAAAGSGSALVYLLGEGMDVDVRGANYRTPLMAAAAANRVEVLGQLLRAGAKTALEDEQGFRALTLAADGGRKEAIEVLAVYSREDLDDALLLAALRGHSGAAGVLADFGASVYARMDDEMTPLMLAAREGHEETIRVLLNHGANRYAVDEEERTAGQIALESGHLGLAEVLNRDPGENEFSLPVIPDIEADDAAVGEVRPQAVVGAIIGGKNEEQAETNGDGGERTGVAIGAVVGGGDGYNVGAEEPNDPDTNEAGPELVMVRYEEKTLPLRVEGVEGKQARVRYLYGNNERVTVKEGEEIPLTGLRVVKVEQRHEHSKVTKGRPTDLSIVVVEDPVTGKRRELVAKLGASAHEPLAILSGGAEPVIVRQGSVVTGPKGRRYKVLDVRPSQVILEDQASGSVHTLHLGKRSH